MKKRYLAFALSLVMTVGMLAACGSSSSTDTSSDASSEESSEEIVYIEDSEITGLFTNPDDYAGKYAKLSGQLLDEPQTDGDITAIQLYNDPENYSQTYIVYTDSLDGIENGDYVFVDGKIDGTFSGENAFGGEVECPLIIDATVTKSSYMEVVTPTIAEITPAASQDQNGVTVSVDKVEYAEDETRVYVTVNNGTEYDFYCGTYSSKLLVDGQQIDINDESMTVYNTPELSDLAYDITAGASSSGVVVFPAMEQGVAFRFVLPDCYSDNYDLTFSNYTVDVPAQ